MTTIRNPHHPWGVERLVRLCKTWDFKSDLDDFEEANGEPFVARAYRRIESAMKAWHDVNPPDLCFGCYGIKTTDMGPGLSAAK
jgi:hypothetical protein